MSFNGSCVCVCVCVCVYFCVFFPGNLPSQLCLWVVNSPCCSTIVAVLPHVAIHDISHLVRSLGEKSHLQHVELMGLVCHFSFLLHNRQRSIFCGFMGFPARFHAMFTLWSSVPMTLHFSSFFLVLLPCSTSLPENGFFFGYTLGDCFEFSQSSVLATVASSLFCEPYCVICAVVPHMSSSYTVIINCQEQS